MKIVVDLAVCQGYAQCAFLAPDAFRIYGEEALLYDPQPDDELRERVVQAAAACPVQAISVERGSGEWFPAGAGRHRGCLAGRAAGGRVTAADGVHRLADHRGR
jgi:ferredoxin